LLPQLKIKLVVKVAGNVSTYQSSVKVDVLLLHIKVIGFPGHAVVVLLDDAGKVFQ
jgi:hypothetical protein